jgi:hypothetical protein
MLGELVNGSEEEEMPSGFSVTTGQVFIFLFGLLAFVLITSLLIGGSIHLAVPFLLRGCVLLMGKLGLQNVQLLVGAAVLLLGVAAFSFKLVNQVIYGVVEVLFAGVAADVTSRQMNAGADWAAQIATLIGAVYIVSRGLSNIKEGFASKQKNLSEHQNKR